MILKNNNTLTNINIYLSALLLISIAFIYYFRLFPFFDFTLNQRDNSFITEESFSIAQRNIYVYLLNWIAIGCTGLTFIMKDKHIGNVISILFLVFSTMFLMKESIYMDEVKHFREEIMNKSIVSDETVRLHFKNILKEDMENNK